MPSEYPRRTVLQSGTVLFATAAAGSTSSTPRGLDRTTSDTPRTTTRTARSYDDSGIYASTPNGPRSYPDRPDNLTRDAVTSYVRAFEHAKVYNSLHAIDAESVSVDCTSVFDTAAHGGHFALASCTGYANYDDGTHADHGQLPAVYFVSDGLTIRVEDLDHRYRNFEEVFAADDPDDNVEQPGDGPSAGYRVYNLDTTDHTLSVTVDFLDADAPTQAFATEYTLPSASGVLQESVTYRGGEYRITAELANGSRATARWTVSNDGYGRHETSIVVGPAGEVTIREPPFDRLH